MPTWKVIPSFRANTLTSTLLRLSVVNGSFLLATYWLARRIGLRSFAWTPIGRATAKTSINQTRIFRIAEECTCLREVARTTASKEFSGAEARGERTVRNFSYNILAISSNPRPIRLSRRPEPFDSDEYLYELKIDSGSPGGKSWPIQTEDADVLVSKVFSFLVANLCRKPQSTIKPRTSIPKVLGSGTALNSSTR